MLIRHPHGISAVDAQYVRPGLAAAHIIEQSGHAAVVDVGTNHSVPHLLAALEELGIERGAVDFILLTHVHLDHAGGAGLAVRELPNARAVVHPRGARHLADPARLIAGTIAVYGEETYRSLYGELLPIARERMLTMHDGQRLSLAGRELLLLETPGHALHHYSILDVAHANVFTGDTFGVSYRELDGPSGAFIVPATTPTQFDPEQLVASIDRLLSYSPQAAYLMHYSRVTGLPRLAELLKRQVRELAAIAFRHAQDANRAAAIRSEMRSLWLGLARSEAVGASDEVIDAVLGMDLELNTQGLVSFLERKASAAY
ncbi:MAG TPA: MBL fold metallo-hydrolase [Steroidobacteraceae bacterium]|nr:MBL fold metallo-hydrolase [Steroidobacteraceae bacterium]